MATRTLKLRYPGTCSICRQSLEKDSEAQWDSATREVTCLDCVGWTLPPDPFALPVSEHGPGTSAQAEHDRRREKRVAKIHAAHPKLVGLLVAVAGEPQSEAAWAKGASGERRIGTFLDSIEGVWTLHDRRVRGSKANIDHLVVAASGVWVVDAKNYKGKLERRGAAKFTVNGRDRTKLVPPVLKYMRQVQEIVGEDVPVRGALCFLGVDVGILTRPFVIENVEVLWPRALKRALGQEGPIDRPRRSELAGLLDRSLVLAT
ncbi:MAG: NERD domain-containing protein [Gammaproteobacteria bacterium]|nr:NERD domain-containing protein [Gammaproteobacteria bacterium]